MANFLLIISIKYTFNILSSNPLISLYWKKMKEHFELYPHGTSIISESMHWAIKLATKWLKLAGFAYVSFPLPRALRRFSHPWLEPSRARSPSSPPSPHRPEHLLVPATRGPLLVLVHVLWLRKLDLKTFMARHHSNPDILFLDGHASQTTTRHFAGTASVCFSCRSIPYHQLLPCESPARGAASLGRQEHTCSWGCPVQPPPSGTHSYSGTHRPCMHTWFIKIRNSQFEILIDPGRVEIGTYMWRCEYVIGKEMARWLAEEQPR